MAINNMGCPYCDAEWESDVDDYSCVDNPEEYECPKCGMTMIMTGEIEVNFSSETAENFYKNRIWNTKHMISRYEKYKEEAETEEDKRYYQRMIDVHYAPELKKAEAALKRCTEHNSKKGAKNDKR